MKKRDERKEIPVNKVLNNWQLAHSLQKLVKATESHTETFVDSSSCHEFAFGPFLCPWTLLMCLFWLIHTRITLVAFEMDIQRYLFLVALG